MGNTILLVDDDPAARRTLAALLQRCGFRIVEAEDGPEALSIIKTLPPDLILSDYNMPGMNAGELLRELRTKQPELSAVPFIIFSGYIDRWPGGPDDPVPDEVLPKPLTMDTLLRSINKALSRRRAAAAAAAARPPQS